MAEQKSKVAYYPGCALEGSGSPYDRSTRAVVKDFGLEMKDLEDWNCCGASEYFSIGPLQGYALVARNRRRYVGDSQNTAHPMAAPSPCSRRRGRWDRRRKSDSMWEGSMDRD